MKSVLFGIHNGQEVYKYSISNGKISADILSYGAIVQSLRVPDRNGSAVDVVLGFNTLKEYEDNTWYIGAVIGRVCNRIEGGKFILNGKTYQVSINNPPNALHGGFSGFDKKVWKVEDFSSNRLVLSCNSLDGEEGYPANLMVKVTYSITIDNGLKIEYEAKSDGDTLVGLTNHSYFNLNGECNGDSLDNSIMINADYITPLNKNLVTYNEFMNVKNTPFDFLFFKSIGQDIDADNEIIKFCGGIDVNYVINGEGFKQFCTAKSSKTGIILKGFTNQIGVQFYTGNFLEKCNGKSGTFDRRYGFCLETQGFPNAINCNNYPSPILKKGEKYNKITEYRFEIDMER